MRSVHIALQLIATAFLAAQAAPSALSDALPPIIASRVQPARTPFFPGDLTAERDAIERNGPLSDVDPQAYGMSLITTAENILLPPPDDSGNVTVSTATTAQVAHLEFYAGVISTAYCRSVVPGNKWDCAHCLSTVPDAKIITTFVTETYGIAGYIIRSDAKKTIYLIFRGTNSINNVISDMKYALTDYTPVKGAKVCSGFYDGYKETAATIVPTMQDQITKYPDYEIVTGGHSLGGAQSLLAALDLYQRDKRFNAKNMKVVTAGGPRVGNPEFAYYVDSTGIPFTRIVHERDVVAHLPPEAMGYLHPGVENWIYKEPSHVHICESNLESNKCSNSIAPLYSVTDHLEYFGINEGLCL
ncbi:hypothetical protein EC973_003996 [Apophysomyces ossiformis]|uniref:Fungal lipase-type domain-containing protein n=1 Tax=Apophysomyces ossiformis TaxID=679940 RepID=A0A8H7BZT7_9FUNG|nr:hypothetical protein EC973_003996 [Apophysomyces ossiformis]